MAIGDVVAGATISIVVEVHSQTPSIDISIDSNGEIGALRFRSEGPTYAGIGGLFYDDAAGVLAICRSISAGATNGINIASTGALGLGTAAPATSALLDMTSTTKALLVPRMTTAERDALTAVNGMILYNSTLARMQGYVGGAWTSL